MTECNHENKRVVLTHLGVQGEPMRVKQLRLQCQECGGLSYNAVSREKVRGAVPSVDEAALKAKLQADHRAYMEEREHLYAVRLTKTAELEQRRRESYQEYLNSPQWMARRQRVLRRAGGTCEGCGVERAQEVHHLTYRNIGNELLWELVAVCRGCHERVHQIRK